MAAIKALVDTPLMERRQDSHKEDPMEELMEVYGEVKDIESNLDKALNICSK